MTDLVEQYIWAEKYRPASVKNLLLPKKLKKYLQEIVSQGQIPNILLHSQSPGTGKTSTAKAICNDLEAQWIYINVSEERSIDTLRNKISQFASTKGFTDSPKIVILDEFDGATPVLQDALRAAMEEYHEYCRFILTCNSLQKIKDPIKSRCQIQSYNMTTIEIRDEMIPKIVKRLCGILSAEGFEYKDEAIENLVKSMYPDQRRMVQSLQQYTVTNSYVGDDVVEFSSVDNKLFELILAKKFSDARRFIIDNGYDPDSIYPALYRNYVPMLTDPEHKLLAIIEIAEYSYKSAFSTDKEIPLAACIVKLMSIGS